MIDKNNEELNNEKACWEEIQQTLSKHNCSLVGLATYYDSDYDFDYKIQTNDIFVESKDFNRRLEKYQEDKRQNEKEEYIKLCKEKYDELLSKYGKYKDLKPYKIGNHNYFWFEGLKFNKKNIKKGLFEWNPNKFWIILNYDGLRHGVSLVYDDFKDWGGSEGKPHFHCYHWHKFSDERKTNCEWFEYKKDVDIVAYQDMINICKIIDDLIKLEVLSL